MNTLYITMGPPASGKSTWSLKKQKEDDTIFRLNPDFLRERLTGSEADISKDAEVWRIVDNMFAYYLSKGVSFIFDATNRSIKARGKYVRAAKSAGYKVIAVDCFSNISLEICKERNKNRVRVVPEFVLEKMAAEFVAPTLKEGFDEIITI